MTIIGLLVWECVATTAAQCGSGHNVARNVTLQVHHGSDGGPGWTWSRTSTAAGA